MRGPMMPRLLEDRFKLEIRRVTRETDVYALIVAKGGIKLKPTETGSCSPLDLNETGPSPPREKPWCGIGNSLREGPNVTWQVRGMTLDAFATTFGFDRPVVNRTGIAGMFDFRLEFAPNTDGAGSDDPTRGPSIFTAVQEQLGLKLVPARGPGEFLAIYHVERPSEN